MKNNSSASCLDFLLWQKCDEAPVVIVMFSWVSSILPEIQIFIHKQLKQIFGDAVLEHPFHTRGKIRCLWRRSWMHGFTCYIRKLRQQLWLCCQIVSLYWLTTREVAWYIISVVSVCPSVCQTITFESLDIGILYLHISREYRSSPCYMKVIGSRSRSRSWEENGRKSIFPQCKTLISNNSGSRKHIEEPWSLRVAWGFRLCRMEWCDRHLCHIPGSDHE